MSDSMTKEVYWQDITDNSTIIAWDRENMEYFGLLLVDHISGELYLSVDDMKYPVVIDWEGGKS